MDTRHIQAAIAEIERDMSRLERAMRAVGDPDEAQALEARLQREGRRLIDLQDRLDALQRGGS